MVKSRPIGTNRHQIETIMANWD